MSTAYTIIEPDAQGIGGLVIDETSNTLKLETTQDDNCILQLTGDLQPEDLMKIFLEGIKVCSYWMDSETFKKTLETLEDYSF